MWHDVPDLREICQSPDLEALKVVCLAGREILTRPNELPATSFYFTSDTIFTFTFTLRKIL